MYINNIFIVGGVLEVCGECKLIGLLFLFCLPLLSTLFLKTKRNDLARPVMGTLFLVSGLFYTSYSFNINITMKYTIDNAMCMPTRENNN